MRKDSKSFSHYFFILKVLNTMARRKYKFLSYNDRKQLEMMHLNNERPSNIAAKLGVHVATIYRELQRGGAGKFSKNSRSRYSAEIAQQTIMKNSKNRLASASLQAGCHRTEGRYEKR